MGELAVLFEFVGAEVHISVDGVGVALFLQPGNHGDNLVNVLRGQGVDVSGPDVEALGVLLVLLHIPAGNRQVIRALFIGLVDDLVVDVREVLHIGHLIAPVLQIAAEHIKDADGTGVADVNIVVHRRAASIDFQLARLHGHQFFLLTGHGVVNFHDSFSFNGFFLYFIKRFALL